MGISKGVVKFLEEGWKLQNIGSHCVAKNTISSFDLKCHGTDERHGCKSFTPQSVAQTKKWHENFLKISIFGQKTIQETSNYLKRPFYIRFYEMKAVVNKNDR